jgi:hypothetical protein
LRRSMRERGEERCVTSTKAAPVDGGWGLGFGVWGLRFGVRDLGFGARS